MVATCPTTFTSNWRRRSSIGTHSSGPWTVMPALFTSPASPRSPTALATVPAAATIESLSATSTLSGCRRSDASDRRSSASLSRRTPANTSKPAASMRSAQARPIPLEVPVMTRAPRDKASRSLCLGIEGEDPAYVPRPVLGQALEREPARLGDLGAVELHGLAVELAAEAPEAIALTVDALEQLAQEAPPRQVDAQLLAHLAHGGLARLFTVLDATARQIPLGPPPAVGVTDEEHLVVAHQHALHAVLRGSRDQPPHLQDAVAHAIHEAKERVADGRHEPRVGAARGPCEKLRACPRATTSVARASAPCASTWSRRTATSSTSRWAPSITGATGSSRPATSTTGRRR